MHPIPRIEGRAKLGVEHYHAFDRYAKTALGTVNTNCVDRSPSPSLPSCVYCSRSRHSKRVTFFRIGSGYRSDSVKARMRYLDRMGFVGIGVSDRS